MLEVAGYTLHVLTCNSTNAGTQSKVQLSFCGTESPCEGAPKNDYNEHGQLNPIGIWNSLPVPLDYEPHTMNMSVEGTDSWCIEQVIWEDGENLLGRGAKLFLDGDLGVPGCQWGVNDNLPSPATTYPCQSAWRFFNLQGSDLYAYGLGVKACARTGSARVVATICSESTCSDTMGEIVERNLTMRGRRGRWRYWKIHVGFNPAAMRWTAVEGGWCAEEAVFNGFQLIRKDTSPVRLPGVGSARLFSNLQYLGLAPRDPSAGSGDLPQPVQLILLEIAVAVVSALVLAAMGFVNRNVHRRICRSCFTRNSNHHVSSKGSSTRTDASATNTHGPMIMRRASLVGNEDSYRSRKDLRPPRTGTTGKAPTTSRSKCTMRPRPAHDDLSPTLLPALSPVDVSEDGGSALPPTLSPSDASRASSIWL